MLKNKYKIILGYLLGNVLEWYEFSLYGSLAPYIAKNFFSAPSLLNNLIYTFAIFIIGHLARPLGGILFGGLGDYYNRQHILFFTLFLAGISTTLIGLIPSYDSIGSLAPLLLLLCRFCQGLSVGGEYPGGTVILSELLASKKKLNLASALPFSGSMIGILLGISFTNFLIQVLSDNQLDHWGWRIPFLFGFILAVLGYYFRRYSIFGLPDSQKNQGIAIEMKFSQRKQYLYYVSCLLIISAVYQGFFTLYIPTYFIFFLHYSPKISYFYFEILALIMTLSFPLAAFITDMFAIETRWLKVNFIVLFSLAYPVFHFVQLYSRYAFVIFSGYAFLVSFSIGPLPGYIMKRLPLKQRFSIYTISHGICFSIFTGSAPLIFTLLCHHISSTTPALYLMLAIAISYFTLTCPGFFRS